MRWIVLLFLAASLFVFWPKNQIESSEKKATRHSSNSLALSERSTRRAARPSSRDFKKTPSKDLQDEILRQWPEIKSGLPARDPRVVKLIRMLRELGRRDGPGTLAFLDQFDDTDKEAEWIQARMAVAGGWALSDPEMAARALLEKDHVLPEDFQKVNGLTVGLLSPSHTSITRAARQIFELWATEAPREAEQAAREVMANGSLWNFGITAELVAIAAPSSTSLLDRNSIDAILNNPNRTSASSHGEAHFPPTEEMNKLGEPASTRGEWAARNPEHALAMIEELKNRGEPIPPSLITGMARENDDYESLLSLVPSSEKVATATHLTVMSMEDPSEQIWLLDGRETTWQLSHEERENAVERLYQSSILTSQERSEITTQLIQIETPVHEVGDSPGGNFAELPNQQKDPAE